MTDRYRLTDETRTYLGRALRRVHWIAEGRDGGWIEDEATLPQDGTALLYDDVIVLGDSARLFGGEFRGGEFRGGTFRGGEFLCGTFWGGTFWGGTFRGGEFRGGTFRGGEFLCGTFLCGTFWGGTFRGGEFRGGEFRGGTFWGGEFRGGTFWDGKFWGGTFWGGTFWDGKFWGGTFWGGEFRCSPACAQRSDGYMFVAHRVGGGLRIWAGCRNFSWNEAVAHWGEKHEHGAESRRIIDFLRAQVEAREAGK